MKRGFDQHAVITPPPTRGPTITTVSQFDVTGIYTFMPSTMIECGDLSLVMCYIKQGHYHCTGHGIIMVDAYTAPLLLNFSSGLRSIVTFILWLLSPQ